MTFYASGRKERRAQLLGAYAKLKNAEYKIDHILKTQGRDYGLEEALENIRAVIKQLIVFDAELEGFANADR